MDKIKKNIRNQIIFSCCLLVFLISKMIISDNNNNNEGDSNIPSSEFTPSGQLTTNNGADTLSQQIETDSNLPPAY